MADSKYIGTGKVLCIGRTSPATRDLLPFTETPVTKCSRVFFMSHN